MALKKSIQSFSNVESIEIDKIVHNGNYRKHIDEEKIIELAESMKSVQLLHPIMVRDTGKGKYHLVFGERRLLAAKSLGGEKIDSRIIQNVKPDKLVEIQLIENVQREQPHPIDESETFVQLTKITSVEQIASTIGVSEQYVYDRIHLKSLNAEIKRLFKDSHITLHHCLQFAKLQNAKQLELLERIKYNVPYNEKEGEHRFAYRSVKEMRRIIEKEFVCLLTKAPFDIEDKRLNKSAGSCINCMKRSGANRTLFGDVQSDDLCFDTKCFWKKTSAKLTTLEKQLVDAGNTVIRIDTSLIPDENEHENLVSLTEVHQIPENEVDNIDSKLFGIIFSSDNIQLLGTVIKLYEKVPEVNEVETIIHNEPVKATVTPSQKRMENVKIKNGRISLKNKLKEEVGFMLGAKELDKMPVSILKMLFYNIIAFNEVSELLENLKWKYDGMPVNSPEIIELDIMKLVNENVNNQSYERVLMEMMIFIVFVTIENNQVYESTFKPIFELAKDIGVDVEALENTTSEDFAITIQQLLNE